MGRRAQRSMAVLALSIALQACIGILAVVAAEDQQQSNDSSGAIIGYHPISNSSLESALPHTDSSQSSEPQVASDQASITTTPGQGETLPTAYLTGILGEGPYTLGRDDVIRINVISQPDFSGDYTVGFDGNIQYSILGDVPVAGMTKFEVEQVLQQLLTRYVRVPSVNVMILAYNSKVVYVIGEVNRPGKFIMRGDAIKLREAVLAAGLPTRDAALGRVHVIKPDLTNPNVRVVNMKSILFKGRLKEDVNLFPGEIVVVPSTVLSSVNRFLGTLLSPVTRVASVAALAAL